MRYTPYVHGESNRVARVPYLVFRADPMDMSDEDLALLLQAGPCFCSRYSLDPMGGGGGISRTLSMIVYLKSPMATC